MSQEATPVSQTEEAVPAAEPETVSAPLRVFDRLFEIVQFVCLSVISLAAVVGFGFEMWRIVTSDGVALGDLLMLFLYTEVIVMARAALHSDHELAILMPIAMAVVPGPLHGCEQRPQPRASDHVCRCGLHPRRGALSVEVPLAYGRKRESQKERYQSALTERSRDDKNARRLLGVCARSAL